MGLRAVVTEIFSAKSDQALSRCWIRCILIIISGHVRSQIFLFNIANEGRISTPSNHASRPSFDTVVDMLSDTLEDAPQSHSTAKKHVSIVLSIHEFTLTPADQAIFRDGYRCVITGKYDISSVMVIKELEEKLNADRV